MFKQNHGRVSERLKELVSKTGIPERVSWVRIPPLPPPPNFVFRFAKCAIEKFDRESVISYTYNISYMRNSANI